MASLVCMRAVSTRSHRIPAKSILHIGCGSGYYSAILASLTGPHGRVTGIEVVPEVAALARQILSHSTTSPSSAGPVASRRFP